MSTWAGAWLSIVYTNTKPEQGKIGLIHLLPKYCNGRAETTTAPDSTAMECWRYQSTIDCQFLQTGAGCIKAYHLQITIPLVLVGVREAVWISSSQITGSPGYLTMFFDDEIHTQSYSCCLLFAQIWLITWCITEYWRTITLDSQTESKIAENERLYPFAILRTQYLMITL